MADTEIEAFVLGFVERFTEPDSDMGRTWNDNQDLNEAYDRGMNFAEWLNEANHG
jgi:hypothetical protein